MNREDPRPAIPWFRRDLRLDDHQGLTAAVATRRPVIPVFVHDETVEALGAAAKWRLGEGLRVLAAALEARGARLILRRGAAGEVLGRLVAEAGAAAVHWQRVYDPGGIARDTGVKAALRAQGVAAESFPRGGALRALDGEERGRRALFGLFAVLAGVAGGVTPGRGLPRRTAGPCRRAGRPRTG